MFILQPLTLPAQLQWRYQDEPALAEWSLKARPYNTDIANGLFVILLLAFAGLMYWFTKGQRFEIFIDGATFFLMASAAFSMTHQKTKFAYRLTKSGLEFCEWKEFPEWLPRLLKWLAVITGVVMLMLVAVHPAALIGAIAGPALIGLMYLRIGTSKEFRDLHESYHHIVQTWDEFDKVIVFRRRSIIGLGYTWYNPEAEIEDKMIRSTRKVYCRKEHFDELIKIVRAQLPESTPHIEGYIQIYA